MRRLLSSDLAAGIISLMPWATVSACQPVWFAYWPVAWSRWSRASPCALKAATPTLGQHLFCLHCPVPLPCQFRRLGQRAARVPHRLRQCRGLAGQSLRPLVLRPRRVLECVEPGSDSLHRHENLGDDTLRAHRAAAMLAAGGVSAVCAATESGPSDAVPTGPLDEQVATVEAVVRGIHFAAHPVFRHHDRLSAKSGCSSLSNMHIVGEQPHDKDRRRSRANAPD